MRFHLPVDRMPTAWFNALPRMPEGMQPPLHPGTREPIGPEKRLNYVGFRCALQVEHSAPPAVASPAVPATVPATAPPATSPAAPTRRPAQPAAPAEPF